MHVLAGTSGFSFAEWRGHFYPKAHPSDEMLRYYAARLPTVEINNSFYRMPKPDMVSAWAEQVPASFSFAVKAPRRITHQQRLVNVGEGVRELFGVVDVLGDRLGPVLFQLPPFLKKDLGVLESFLSVLPEGRRAALEFRHPSWFTDDVYAALASKNVALVGGDLDDGDRSPPLVATADFGYLRLRRQDYDPPGIVDWNTRIGAQPWQSVFAYLKHEVLGPHFAQALLDIAGGLPMADLSAIRASIAAPKPAKSARGTTAKPSKAPTAKPSKPPTAKPSKAAAGRTSEAPTARVSKAPAEATEKRSGKPKSRVRRRK